jgi:transcriptional regulator with XRE-family HTH domain
MNHLREVRFKKRLNQYRLALLTQVHQSRISLIENDLIEPRDYEKKKLAEALGVKSEDLFPEDDLRKAG